MHCGTYRHPLPNLFTYIAQPQGYDIRQSTSTQLIPPCPADPPPRRSDQPCPVLPLLQATAGYCRRTSDGGNYYYYLLVVLVLLQLLLLLLWLLLLLLLQRTNEFHTKSDHSTWYTVCPNNPILHLQWVSIQQLLCSITEDPCPQDEPWS